EPFHRLSATLLAETAALGASSEVRTLGELFLATGVPRGSRNSCRSSETFFFLFPRSVAGCPRLGSAPGAADGAVRRNRRKPFSRRSATVERKNHQYEGIHRLPLDGARGRTGCHFLLSSRRKA